MDKLLDRVTKELPQIDRICVSRIDDGKLVFAQVAQPVVLNYPLGGVERSYPVAESTLARYIQAGQPVVNAQLPEQGADMTAMRRTLGSSVHLPITIDGQPALISYWSKEKDAFPAAAVDFLKEITQRLGAK
jgi:predicted SnoaL-like aldol condensation-catalyzing enzyme